MSITGSEQWMYSSGGSFYDHLIDQSLRITSGGSLKNDTVASTTRNYDSAKIFTYSFWTKLQGNAVHIISLNDTPATGEFTILYNGDNTFRVYSNGQFDGKTSALFRDFSAWYHVCLVMDTTQATAANRARLYINGTLYSLTNQPSQNLNVKAFTTATRGAIGARYQDNGTINYQANNGAFYIAEFIYADGVKHEPTVFGETKSGVWIPKDVSSISLGTNGYHLDFSDQTLNTSITTNSGFGKDVRSNMPNPQWITQGNLAVHDGMPDSPTNNFCTINRLDVFNSSITTTEGNLVLDNLGATTAKGTFEIPKTGKYYFEVHIISQSGSIGDNVRIGIAGNTEDNSFSHTNDCRYVSNGTKIVNGSNSSYGASIAVGDTVGVAINADDDEVTFFKNGASQGAISYTLTADIVYVPFISQGSGSKTFDIGLNFGADSTFAGTETAATNTDETGTGVFNQAVPSGFSALCSASLPEPTITPLNDDIPEDYFNTVLYAGTGSSQSITGVGFQPDWVWTKTRDGLFSHKLYDSVRGVYKDLESDTADTETESTSRLQSFDSDGFRVGGANAINNSGKDYVAWNWLAGSTAVSNTNGAVPSSVSANTKAGFSIVSFVGTGSNTTVGHGLGTKPDMMIFKNRDALVDWYVYHQAYGATKGLKLNETGGNSSITTPSTRFNNTEPTETVFTVGTSNNTNGSTQDMIAYCFHSVEGYSKFGSYTGNGNANGTFVYTGFRPAFVITKKSSGTSNWNIIDNHRPNEYNPANNGLLANENLTETTLGTSHPTDLLSNGFKFYNNEGGFNGSATYIFMAFAEMPTKYANAR